MGIAYHALPRILGVGAAGLARQARRARRLLADVRRRHPAQRRPADRPRTVGPARSRSLSAAMELASAYFFVRFVFASAPVACARESTTARDPLLRFVRSGTLFFAAPWPSSGAQGLWLAGNADSVLPASLNEPFYFAALYGFLLAWIYGFGNRIVSLFLGVGPGRPRNGRRTRSPLQAAGVRPRRPLVAAGAAERRRTRAARRRARPSRPCRRSCTSRATASSGAGATLPMLRTPGNPGFAIRAAFGMPRPLGGPGARRRAPDPADAPPRAEPLVGRRGAPRVHDRVPDAPDRRHELPDPSGLLRQDRSGPRASPTRRTRCFCSERRCGCSSIRRPSCRVFYEIGSYMGIPVVLGLVLYVFNLVRTMRGRPAPAHGRRRPVLDRASCRRCRCDNPRRAGAAARSVFRRSDPRFADGGRPRGPRPALRAPGLRKGGDPLRGRGRPRTSSISSSSGA